MATMMEGMSRSDQPKAGQPCLFCGEPVDHYQSMGQPIYDSMRDQWRYPHRECALREVLGGIGHLRDHAFWCGERHDPDGGMSRRESARLVWQWVQMMGAERVAEISHEQMGHTGA